MTFQIHALNYDAFDHLFSKSDDELKALKATREIVQSKPGTPCRVSLADAEVGETVILLNYEHQPAQSPFQSSHAIFVRENAPQAKPAIGEVPDVLLSRLISVRIFDENDNMIDADVVDGADLQSHLQTASSAPSTSYIHLHYAKPGCFAARVTGVRRQ